MQYIDKYTLTPIKTTQNDYSSRKCETKRFWDQNISQLRLSYILYHKILQNGGGKTRLKDIFELNVSFSIP